MIQRGKKQAVKWTWGVILAWFSASLLSQAAYIGTHGTPYEATMLLDSLGQWSWALLVVEAVVWLMLGNLLLQKFQNIRNGEQSAA